MTKTELSKVKIPQNTGLSVSMWACEAGISLYVVISQLHSCVSIVALLLPPQLTAALPHQLPAWVLAFIPRSAKSRLFVPPFSNNFCHSIKEKTWLECLFLCFCLLFLVITITKCCSWRLCHAGGDILAKAPRWTKTKNKNKRKIQVCTCCK